MTATTSDLLAAALARDPAGPLFTHYDDRTGERVELSATTLANWVSKTANLLTDGAGLGPGDRAAVLLPPHWQGAAIMLGCWAAGLSIAHSDAAGAAPGQADVTFAAADRADEALGTGAADVYLLSLLPLGRRLPSVPAGTLDYAAEVPGFGDHFPGGRVTGATPALVGPVEVDQGGMLAAAAARATELGLRAGDRLLVVDADGHRPRPLDWLLAPLAVGASVVLVREPDPGALPRRAADERVTATLGAEVPGIRRAG